MIFRLIPQSRRVLTPKVKKTSKHKWVFGVTILHIICASQKYNFFAPPLSVPACTYPGGSKKTSKHKWVFGIKILHIICASQKYNFFAPPSSVPSCTYSGGWQKNRTTNAHNQLFNWFFHNIQPFFKLVWVIQNEINCEVISK